MDGLLHFIEEIAEAIATMRWWWQVLVVILIVYFVGDAVRGVKRQDTQRSNIRRSTRSRPKRANEERQAEDDDWL
jgi:hypothetical protein